MIIQRTVYTQSQVKWAGNLSELVPDMGMQTENPDEKVSALGLLDETGHLHVFAFSEAGKADLLKQLTGGIIIPEGAPK